MIAGLSQRYELARRGKYFVGTNPTPGTGVAMGIQTSFSDTANVLFLCQGAGKIWYPDYLRLICTAAGASTTASDIAIVTDTISRFSAGGTGSTKVNVFENGQASNVVPTLGAITAVAAVNKRVLARLRVKTQAAPCWVVGDQVMIRFGADAPNGQTPTNGAATQVFAYDAAPAIVPANGSFLVHMWNTANATTPPSWEWDFGWFEE